MKFRLLLIIAFAFFFVFLKNFSFAETITSKTHRSTSTCYNFHDSVIDNYNLIKDHNIVEYVSEDKGILLEETWDPKKIRKVEYSWDGTEKEILGDKIFYRDVNKNIKIQNIQVNLFDKIAIRPGDTITKIDGKFVKNLTDDEIDDLLGEDKPTHIEYYRIINNKKILKKETLKYQEVTSRDKYLMFKIVSFNNIDPKTFTTEFFINYQIVADMWDGEDVDHFNVKPKEDNFFKLGEHFRYTDDSTGVTDYYPCHYSDDDLEKMQLFSPAYNVELKNVAFVSEDEYEWEHTFSFREEDVNDTYTATEMFSIFKGIVKTKNNFDLRTFPFDKQEITFRFAETVDAGLNLVPWDVYADMHELKKQKTLIPGWKFKEYRIKGFLYQETGWYKGSYGSGIDIILEIEREFQYYIYKVLFPILLILIVCWSVFWIPPRELESKLTITIVCLLSLIAYNFVVTDDIPRLSYLTIMDHIILVSYLYATIPNFLTIASYRLHKGNRIFQLRFLGRTIKISSDRIDRISRIYGPISYAAIVILIIIVSVHGNDNTAALFAWLT